MSEEKTTNKRKKAVQTFDYGGLTEKQIKAVELLETGNYTKEQIAEMIGVHRNTMTTWCKDDVFRAAVKECADEKTKTAYQKMKANTAMATDKVINLINSGDKNLEFIAAKYLLDRVFGKTTAKVQIEDSTDDTTDFDIDAAIAELENEAE